MLQLLVDEAVQLLLIARIDARRKIVELVRDAEPEHKRTVPEAPRLFLAVAQIAHAVQRHLFMMPVKVVGAVVLIALAAGADAVDVLL